MSVNREGMEGSSVVAKRHIMVVHRPFQRGLMLRFVGFVVGGITISFLVMSVYYFFRYSQSDLDFTFYFVTGEIGGGLRETTLMALVFPSLVVSALLSGGFTLFFALRYSNRIAGPLFNLRRVIRRVRQGKLPERVRFRKGDEFQELAAEMTKTLAWLRERPGLKMNVKGKRS